MILYYLFYLESGTFFSEGGDDFGFASRIISGDFFNPFHIISNSILNYPLFYYVNLFYSHYLIDVNQGIIHIALLTINNFLAGIMLYQYQRNSSSLKFKSFTTFFLFTTLIYFSSIFIRDIYIYVAFYCLYYHLKKEKFNFFYVVLLTLVAFLTRPESALIFMLYIFLTKNSLLNSFSVLLLFCVLYFFYESSIQNFFRSTDQLKSIYFENSTGLTQQNGISYKLQSIEGIKGDIIWFIYNLFRPIPPYLFKSFSLENIILFLGQLFNYFLVIKLFIVLFTNKKEILNPLILIFLFSVGIVSFYGGTQRHYVYLLPLIFYELSKYNGNINKISSGLFSFLLFVIIIISV